MNLCLRACGVLGQVTLSIAVMIATSGRIDAASLKFQKTNSQMHIALQPRKDHHRVHFVVKAEGLQGRRCVAQLSCLQDTHPLTTSRAIFTPTTSDQTFAIYLRTPKILNRNATYRLDVAPADPEDDPDQTSEGSLVYKWTINRNADGTAVIAAPGPGEMFTVSYIARAVGREEVGGEVKFTIRYETRAMTITVPAGFVFGVDTQGNTDDIFEPVRILGIGG